MGYLMRYVIICFILAVVVALMLIIGYRHIKTKQLIGGKIPREIKYIFLWGVLTGLTAINLINVFYWICAIRQ